ncbi:endonuclease, HNH family [Piscinibacter sakaiensis]|uniref:Endonuclease, HNH family n=2 Tax=Piscinibacter sakaiensis TaxID=1547922 RepID=A0A0K8P400_PISS1|nr:endonuclease, HNH family [Piscinibacter sakaiensis]
MIEIYGRSYVAARLAWLYMHGEWPEHQIDHRDRDRLNDAASNLRSATGKQNCENRGTRADNRSGVPGVHHRPEYTRPWLAKIGHEGRQIHIGTFATKDEAVAARRAAERRYFTHKEVIT